MTIRAASAAAIVPALFALALVGTAAAQSTDEGSVSVNTSANTGSVSSGDMVDLGTITLTHEGGDDVSIESIPISISANNNASLDDLSDCQLYDSDGDSVTADSAVNPDTDDSFTFDDALTLRDDDVVSFTVRCDVDSSSSNGSYRISAGEPVLIDSDDDTVDEDAADVATVADTGTDTVTTDIASGPAISYLADTTGISDSGVAPATSVGTTAYTSATAPGVPNTGVGGALSAILTLIVSALTAFIAGLFLQRSLR